MNALKPQPEPDCDVLILGGGLAGLSLALQLRQRCAGIRVMVLERRAHPVPLAAHKVGESTVEIGAHYFANVLGLKQHLQDEQLKKFGFRFFFSEGRRDIENVTELGASSPLPVPSYQIDRGLFENFLGAEVQRRGVHLHTEALVREVRLSQRPAVRGTPQPPHEVVWQQQGRQNTTRARWVVDACGRAGIIKRDKGLALPNEHAAHAVWFRVKHRIHVDGWASSAEWAARTDTPTRWLSTNHLVGAGYWVWLIPLASGSHSVGIVADPAYHALGRMDSFDKAMDWLREFQPRLWDELDPVRGSLQDFAFFRRFSYDCKQTLSADRWALTGEAGRFLDPFYSPGSDFIAIGNTMICELVARDRSGAPIAAHVQVSEQILKSFYDSTLALYTHQYGLFGCPGVLPTKVIWDYTYYWGVLAPLFFQQRLTDLVLLSQLRDELALCQRLNVAVQALLRAWGEAALQGPQANPAVLLDQASVPWFAELNRALSDTFDQATLRLRLQAATTRLQTLAAEMAERAAGEMPALQGHAAMQALRAALKGFVAEAGATPMLFPPLRSAVVEAATAA